MRYSLNLDLNKFLVLVVAVVGLMSSSFFRTQHGSQILSSDQRPEISTNLSEVVSKNCKNKYHLTGHKNSRQGLKLINENL